MESHYVKNISLVYNHCKMTPASRINKQAHGYFIPLFSSVHSPEPVTYGYNGI